MKYIIVMSVSSTNWKIFKVTVIKTFLSEVKISEKKKIAEKIKEKERQQKKRQEEIKKRVSNIHFLKYRILTSVMLHCLNRQQVLPSSLTGFVKTINGHY